MRMTCSYIEGYGLGYMHAHLTSLSLEEYLRGRSAPWAQGYVDGYRDGSPQAQEACS